MCRPSSSPVTVAPKRMSPLAISATAKGTARCSARSSVVVYVNCMPRTCVTPATSITLMGATLSGVTTSTASTPP